MFTLRWSAQDTYHNYQIEVYDSKNNYQLKNVIKLKYPIYPPYKISSDGNFIIINETVTDNLKILNLKSETVYEYENKIDYETQLSVSNDMNYIAANQVRMYKGKFFNSGVAEPNIEDYLSFIQTDNLLKIYRTDTNTTVNYIKISDINGNLITSINSTEILNCEMISINIENFSNGTYYMNLETNNGTFTHSFVIVR